MGSKDGCYLFIHCRGIGDDYCNQYSKLDFLNLRQFYFEDMKDDFEGYLTEFTDEEYLEATWVSMCLTWFEYDDEDECKSWITTDNGQ